MNDEQVIKFFAVSIIFFVIGISLISILSVVKNKQPIVVDDKDACMESLNYEYICNNYLENENFNSCRYKALTLLNCGMKIE